MTKFLADENIPDVSVRRLAEKDIDVVSVSSDFPSINDESVILFASLENRIILTFDRDYGELVFKRRILPPPGIIYFRLNTYQPEEPAQIVLKLLTSNFTFDGFLTVITKTTIRQRRI